MNETTVSGVADCPQPTSHGHSPQDDEPRLPDGYRPIRDAIRTLLMYALEDEI